MYGIYEENEKFKIGNKIVNFNDNHIIIDPGGINKKHRGTIGLSELITSKNPDVTKDGHITKSDWDNYKEILPETSALKRNYDPNEKYPISSKGTKWNKNSKSSMERINSGCS